MDFRNKCEEKIWQGMLARSFSPRQWFEEDYEDRSNSLSVITEDKIMWVYRKAGESRWEVGYFSPDKTWNSDGEFFTVGEAAQRVHWLNGGM